MRKVNQINWNEIQVEYDTGVNTQFLIKKYKLSCQLFSEASKLGLFKPRTKSESKKMFHKLNPGKIKHSEESKKLISERRKAYLKANPDKVPYLLNHKHKKKFYSEIYFEECFRNTNIQKEYKVSLYSLDFADPVNKIDIEIDGEQHFVDPKMILHDKERNDYLSVLGWTIIRVRWSKFQKLTFEEKSIVVNSIIKYQNPNHKAVAFINPNTNPDLVTYYEKTHNFICSCGAKKWRTSDKCIKCYNSSVQIKMPFDKNKLHELLWSFSIRKISNLYKISQKTVRKWAKLHNVAKPSLKYWQKYHAGLIIDYQI